ncbi:mechanosensitive ion channel [Seiridium cupressi]|uniref:Mechanosensitive ion channel protein n=1 Tax=Seiridium unicorne TaxID=138068 RepID=A0ABR2UYX8_9PEZI
MAQTGSHDMEKDGSPTLTHAPTVSDTDHNEKEKPPNLRLQLPARDSMDRASSEARSPSQYLSPGVDNRDREQATRLVDDLTMLHIQQMVSNQEDELSRSMTKVRSRQEPVSEDVFNAPTHTVTLGTPQEPPSKLNKVFKGVKKLPRVVRYFFYLLPITAILLIPIFLGIFLDPRHQTAVGGTGGTQLLWFGIWLEIVWLSLWAARIVTAIFPFVASIGAKIVGSGNPKKWKAMGLQLELPTALFLWMLAVLVSFMPILNDSSHKVPAEGDNPFPDVGWIETLHKVIIALFILAVLNWVEKILIQWIANSFHLRTYSTRIETNKQSIAYLVHLFVHSRDNLVSEESVKNTPGQVASGARTPMKLLQNNARNAFNKVGDAANRVAGDFTGREVTLSNHPRKVVSELLRNTASAQVLARRLFRTYAKADSDVLRPEDLNPAFPTPEDAENAFGIFDRDLNGDVSMDELEAFCDEVHREKKAIAASVKDLDSVIRKLDQVFVVVVIVITIIVFISIISSSAATALTSAGTVILGLSWLLQATAQEFLQSIIFVFVKHPFDIGDRVTVYGNTGAAGTGDDYYVIAISLLYTEFKKMEGHIVQAPNSLLNTLFILNHRRSGQLADVFELRMKHGTPREHIEELQARMTEYVLEHRRDFTGKIITEMKGVEDAYCITVNFICFHKSSFQNELLRLTRHNKFGLELMTQMVNIGIEQPRRQYQISGREFPIYQTNVQPPAYDAGYPAVDTSKLAATRRARSDSRLSAQDQDFYQDIFSSRKAHPTFAHQPPIAEETNTSAPTASGAINPLERTTSMTSGSQRAPAGHRLFGRSMTHRSTADKRSERDMV